jgi:hypothetical protein
MAATGDGNGRGDKRTGGTRPPTIELTATEVPPADRPKDASATDAAPKPGVSPLPDTGPADSGGTGSVHGNGKSGSPVSDTAMKQSDAPVKQPDAAVKQPAAGTVPPTPSAGASSGTAAAAAAGSAKPAPGAVPPVGATARSAATAAAASASPKDAVSTRADEVAASRAAEAARATDASRAASTPPANPPARRGVGAAGLIAAALVGGVVGLGGALAVTHYGIIPLPAPTAADGTADLAARVDALSAAVSSAPASDPDAAAALREAVSALSQRVDALAAAAVPPATEQALSDRLSAIEEKVAATIPGGGSADATALAASVTALGDRLDGLAGEVATLAAAPPAAAGDPAALSALGDRVGALDRALGERIAAVDTALGAQVTALDDRLDQRLDALEQSLGTVGEQLTALEAAREQAAALVAALGDRLGAVEAVDPAEAARAPAAVAFATQRLGVALAEGRPYAAEITALSPRLPESEDVKTLAATAEAGVPTRAALAAMLALEKPAILAAGAPAPAPAGEAGPLDALLSGAQSLVSIRPTGPESGDPVATGVEAVTSALAAGDLAAADAAWTALPEAARAAGAGFGAGLSQRIAAEAAYARLEAAVLARLDGATE